MTWNALFLTIGACGGPEPRADMGGTPVEEPAPILRVRPAEGVAQIEVSCAEAADETCNAVDDDCDARIDEGCGWDSGPVQVVVAWNRGVDLELLVDGGGVAVDHDGRGDCEAGPTALIENARAIEAVREDVEISLRRKDACGAGDDPVTASVAIAANGRVLGVFNLSVGAETVEVAELDPD